MKMIRNMACALLLAGVSVPSVIAAECEVNVMTLPVEQVNSIPDEINEQLMTRLTRALTNTGIAAGPDFCQFFVTGKFTDYYKDVVPGPPKGFVMHTQLTLYVGDLINQSVYSTCSFELRGVGASEQRAYINALSTLNGRNREFSQFVESAKDKIVSYYDKNYPAILAKADRAASMRNYEEALMYATSIPECSKGFGDAVEKTLAIYQMYIDYEGQMLLTAAQGAWAADPDRKGAVAAYGYLRQIDPAASCFGEAQKLMNEIKSVVKENWDFEHKQKYKDEIELRRAMIEAARAVGVAYGNGQQPTTTNLMWLR